MKFLIVISLFLINTLAFAEPCSWQKNWKVHEQLGQGKFGDVNLVTEKSSGKKFALKEQKEDDYFKKEVLVYKDLMKKKFPYVPKLHSAWSCEGKGYIVMEKKEQCFDTGRLSKAQISTFASNLKKALEAFNLAGWTQTDLALRNIVCDNNGVYLIDFGLVDPLSDDETREFYLDLQEAQFHGIIESLRKKLDPTL